MAGYWPYIVPGLVSGAIFALLAVGVVLTYQTTGVLNLAFGAQAYVSAVVYYDLRVSAHWGAVPAVLMSVFVAAPFVGYLLDRLVFQHLRAQPPVVRLAVSIGMLTALPAIVGIVTGGNKVRAAAPPIVFKSVHYYQWGSLNIDSDQVAVIVSTVVVLVALGLVMRYSTVGLRMRAVVESGRLAELHGVGAPGINTVAWLISSGLAGLAGVMLAPLFPALSPIEYTLLLMAALAGAVFGRLRSLSLAVVGALLTGIGQNLIIKWTGVSGALATGLRPSFPFLFLFVLLLTTRTLQRNTRVTDPMAAVDPPPTLAQGSVASLPGTAWQRRAVLGVIGLLGFLVLNQYWSGVFAEAALMSVVFLALMLITGQGGYISLCHAAFVGVGAFVAAQLAIQQDVPIFFGALIGGAVAGVGGLLLAIPSLRLGELSLALATFGFGLLCENLVFNQSWAFGTSSGLFPPRPQLGPFDLHSNKSFLVLSLAVLAVMVALCRRLLAGTTGRFATALRGSETAAASIGINAVPLKLAIFTLSAAMAGFAGGLLGSLKTVVAPTSYTSLTSMFWLVIVLVIGVYTIRGAVAAGVVFVLLPEILSHLPQTLGLLQFVLFGLGVVSLAKHPEGALEFLLNTPARLRERTRILSGGATDEDRAVALENVLLEPEPTIADVVDDPDTILQSTAEDRLARRRRRRELSIEAAKLRVRIPAYPVRFLYLMTLAFVVDYMSRGLLALTWDDIRRDLHLSDAALGPLNAAFLVVAALALIPAGRLADRTNRVKLLALAFVPWAAAMVLQGIAPAFSVLLILRMFLGSVEGIHGPTTPSLLGDYYPVKRRNRVFGIFGVGSVVGLTLGTLIGGAIAESLGWRGTFVLFGVIGALLSVWLVTSLREPDRGLQDALYRIECEIEAIDRLDEREAEALANPHLADAILGRGEDDAPMVEAAEVDETKFTFVQSAMSVLRRPTFTFMLVGQAFNDAFLGIFGLWLLVFLRRYFSLSLVGAGGVGSILSIGIVIGTVHSGTIGDRLVARGTPVARVRLSVVTRILFFLASLVAFSSRQLVLALPFLFISGYLLGMSGPVAEAMALDVVPAHMRGQASALRGAARAGFTALGPLVLGILSDLYGLRQAFLMLAPAVLFGAIVTAFASTTYERDEADAQLSALRHAARLELLGADDATLGERLVPAGVGAEPAAIAAVDEQLAVAAVGVTRSRRRRPRRAATVEEEQQ